MTLLALPFMEGWFVRDLQLGLFYIVAISGVTVIGYLMAGWASDNKYALLGAVRSAAQLISYEIPLILAVLAVSMVAGSLNLNDITLQQDTVPNLLLQPLPFVILLIAVLAELSRRPFDIPIGESELVGGPWVEYSGIRWSIIFALTEYASLWGFSILGCAGVPRRLGVALRHAQLLGRLRLRLPAAARGYQVVPHHPDRDVDQRDVPAPAHRPADGVLLEDPAAVRLSPSLINGIVLTYEPPEVLRDVLCSVLRALCW